MHGLDLWATRKDALTELQGQLKVEAALLQQQFAILDQCIERLGDHFEDSAYVRVCGLTVAKGRNLALACYSLALDGLAQEAGAVFRPLLETVELLTYFRNDPSRVEEALDGRLPSAGKIAERNAGSFKEIRQYLSRHASHFGLSFESVRHLIDFKALVIKTVQPHNIKVLRANLRSVFALLMWLVLEAVSCLYCAGIPANQLADEADDLKSRGLRVFAS